MKNYVVTCTIEVEATTETEAEELIIDANDDFYVEIKEVKELG